MFSVCENKRFFFILPSALSKLYYRAIHYKEIIEALRKEVNKLLDLNWTTNFTQAKRIKMSFLTRALITVIFLQDYSNAFKET